MFSKEKISEILETALKKGGQWADLFLEETHSHQAHLSDQVTKNIAQNTLSGAGIRVVADLKEFYAYTNDLSEKGLLQIAREVSEAVGQSSPQAPGKKISFESKSSTYSQSPRSVSWEHKIALLKQANELCRSVSPKIIQVNVDYFDETQQVLIANSDGLYKEDRRMRGRFSLSAVAGDGSEKQVGYEAPGALKDFSFFESLDISRLVREATETALRMLDADYAPQGRMPVLIDAGFGGVIFHEACGHLLEASAVAKNATVLANRLNQPIASSCVSAVDDGTLLEEWGTTHIDDEGFPTRRNLLIENGILKSYLVDRLNGERLNLSSTASARRQSYRFSPTSRMNNTFILPGPDRLEDMIAQTPYGLYAKKMGGGSVNPATGEFNFAVTEGYLIQSGKITVPVRGAVLIGRGEEILKKIDRVGHELKLAQGMCGAASGWVPVNVGQPAIRVQDLLVGGQSSKSKN